VRGVPAALAHSIATQTTPPDEVEVVLGVRPSGRARNIGVARTRADVLVFVDDDAVLGAPDLVARLVAALDDPSVGVVGASKVLPPSSSPFQRRVARDVPRIVHPVVDEPLETNPPLDRHGYSEVTTTCCALRREVFDAADGFDERLARGVDTEFLRRVCRLGYRIVLAGGTWAYHPPPATLRELLRKHFLYGIGYSQEVRLDPSVAAGRLLSTPLHAAAYGLARTAWIVPSAFLPYSYAEPSWRPAYKPLKALTGYASALGYVYGWYRCRPIGERRCRGEAASARS
jgi:glycosyltransferase involved in cell wall biosynthesis